MALRKLKKVGRDAQAFLDESSGKDNLSVVLVDMAKANVAIQAEQSGAMSEAVLGRVIYPFPVRLLELVLLADDWGDSGNTEVEVTAGTLDELVTVPNTQTNGVPAVITPIPKNVIPVNTIIQLEVVLIPGTGTPSGLIAVLIYSPVDIE